MELLNEVLTNQVVQALLVLRISKDWQEDILYKEFSLGSVELA